MNLIDTHIIKSTFKYLVNTDGNIKRDAVRRSDEMNISIIYIDNWVQSWTQIYTRTYEYTDTRVQRRSCTAGDHKISLMPFQFKFDA